MLSRTSLWPCVYPHARIQRGAEQGSRPPPPPPGKSQKYRVSQQILVQIPLKITQLLSQHSMLGHHRHVIVVLGSYLYSSTKTNKKKLKFGPPLSKHSGSAHAARIVKYFGMCEHITVYYMVLIQ